MNQPSTTFPPAAVEALRRTVEGLIAYPSDPSYSSFLPAPGAGPAPAPDVVVVPDTEEAVRAAVDVARVHGLTVSGDLEAAAPSTSMLVLTHLLDELVVDVDARTATLGPGVSWARLAAALDAKCLGIDGAGPPDSGVIDAVLAGLLPVTWARVVRGDGFVHVVPDYTPPVDDPGPWLVTAVGVPLSCAMDHPTTQTQHEEIPS